MLRISRAATNRARRATASVRRAWELSWPDSESNGRHRKERRRDSFGQDARAMGGGAVAFQAGHVCIKTVHFVLCDHLRGVDEWVG